MLGRVVIAAILASSVVHASEMPPPVRHINERYAISAQIRPEQIADLKGRGYTTVVALRPDGESADQPTASDMEAAAKANGIRFVYIPVTSAGMSESQIGTLSAVIASDSGKVLAYCRSGSRAARLWSLAEATRDQGASKDDILRAVKAAGQSADNLESDIVERIARRKSSD
jgi:uncharacterized protein (TIGR01244 family)